MFRGVLGSRSSTSVVGDDTLSPEVQLCVAKPSLPSLAVTLAFDEEIFAVVAESWHELAHLLLDCFCGLWSAGQYELNRFTEHGVRASVAHLSGSECRPRLPHNLGESALCGWCRAACDVGLRLAKLGLQGSELSNSVRIHLASEASEREHVLTYRLNQAGFSEKHAVFEIAIEC